MSSMMFVALVEEEPSKNSLNLWEAEMGVGVGAVGNAGMWVAQSRLVAF